MESRFSYSLWLGLVWWGWALRSLWIIGQGRLGSPQGYGSWFCALSPVASSVSFLGSRVQSCATRYQRGATGTKPLCIVPAGFCAV